MVSVHPIATSLLSKSAQTGPQRESQIDTRQKSSVANYTVEKLYIEAVQDLRISAALDSSNDLGRPLAADSPVKRQLTQHRNRPAPATYNTINPSKLGPQHLSN